MPVPLASIASASAAWLVAPPVPRMRRDPSSWPAIVSPLPTLHRRQYLDRVAVGQAPLVPGRTGYHVAVHRHCHPGSPAGEPVDEVGDAGRAGQYPVLAV